MLSDSQSSSVVVPLVTPVTSDGSLDEAAAERLVENLASNGCGMLVLGTTGEVASLTSELRQRYVEIAVRVTRRRTPVFACVAHNVLSDAIALARHHLASGVDAVVGLLPNYYKLEPAEMEAYFVELARAVSGPVFLYNMPQTTGMSLPIEVIERLSRHDNIAGLKDSESTAGRIGLLAERLGGRKDFSLFMGVAANSVAALRSGFAGIVPSSGNLVPAQWRKLADAARSGNWNKAEALQAQLDKLSVVLQTGRSLGQSLAALKAALAARGLCSTNMLPPLQSLTHENSAALAQEIKKWEKSIDES